MEVTPIKKHLAFFLSTALVLSALVSCAPAGGSLPTSPSVSPTGTADAPPAEPSNLLSSFTTTTLEGNEVDASLLSEHKLTMVNIWATYCPPCLKELPALGEIHASYAESGDFQVVGLVSDVHKQDGTLSTSQVDLALEIVEKTAANFPHIIISKDFYSIFAQVEVVPFSFFVDAEGKQVGSAYPGARSKAEWLAIIEPLLADMDA